MCLSLGWSSRYNDREGIGRFGVGMKLGAIHQCKRVEVWSKQQGADWLYTYIDLDEIEEETMANIPYPVSQQPPEEYASLAGAEHGTLVVWSTYDNLRMRLSNLLRMSNHGRVVRSGILFGTKVLKVNKFVRIR